MLRGAPELAAEQVRLGLGARRRGGLRGELIPRDCQLDGPLGALAAAASP